MKVAAIGDKIFVSAFTLIGAKGFSVERDEDALHLINKLIEKGGYSMIIVPERYVDLTKKLRYKIVAEGKITPLFAFVPEKGIKKRVQELKNLISSAIGVKLEL